MSIISFVAFLLSLIAWASSRMIYRLPNETLEETQPLGEEAQESDVDSVSFLSRGKDLCDPAVKQVYGYYSGSNGRRYSWNTRANLLFVDQPAGAGFADGPPVTNGSFGAADDLYMALQEFLAKHTQYRGKDFYITGESYAGNGHYIPAIAHKILREITRGIEPHIPLRGLAIGNGWMNAAIQVLDYPEMAFQSCTAPHVATRKECEYIRQCSVYLPVQIPDDEYDMRITSKDGSTGDIGDARLERYLNRKDVQRKLGVCKRFKSCSDVGDFSMDEITPTETLLPDLLDAEIRVLLYDGDQDYICNWIGYEHVANEMAWPGRDAFLRAPRYEYEGADGISVGLLRSIRWKEKGMFGFFQVYRAGHLVPTEQPEAALLMINDFIDGIMGPVPFTTTVESGNNSPEL
ncbi:hypothetical protein FOZ60_001216 [Perkinsus olseni]|uniref:Carboxypeptidase n=2 Tax=Perkinsus olseni TaxID=32597 RepID=A0A7J6P0S1_PEROL|nr:hypothetical protein FOZ60_001216 [Perkinsus olseni]